MSFIAAILLGLVQGLTEFLPVSSSGHLVLAAHLLGFREPHLLFDLALHMGTLIATVTFFWASFRGMAKDGVLALGDARRGTSFGKALQTRPDARLLWLVVIGSIPTALIGALFKDSLEAMFGDARATMWQLLMTAGLLLATVFVRTGKRDIRSMGIWDALAIGIAQGLAITPGISRSGATIACGLFLGIDRELTARYSFLMSVPAIAGAFMLKLLDVGPSVGIAIGPTLAGFVVALVIGFLSLAFLMPVVRRGRVWLFALYLAPLSAVGLWLL